MPVVKCPVPDCQYETDDVDAVVVAALLTTHATDHSAAASAIVSAKIEKLKRPTDSSAGSSENWTYFVSRWKDYIQAFLIHKALKPLLVHTVEDEMPKLPKTRKNMITKRLNYMGTVEKRETEKELHPKLRRKNVLHTDILAKTLNVKTIMNHYTILFLFGQIFC
ncbi:unnamed protein product [Mytilus coruscus]|uniref:Uncharacterized protein n=1 Tax=Mytilus coruscus TaxID=42192 RepID=A0A6J8AAC0_MYTCO|nr:unnamed protein product [Mytilus coruscus]